MPRIPVPAWPCGHNGAVRATTSRPPGWLVACKVLLAGLLLTGALFPDTGGFAGKGMAYRLPVFLAPALVVPIIWWRRRGPYPAALDAALTLPFLLDTAANAVGLYDHLDATDDILHFVNWFVLVGGITATWVARSDASIPTVAAGDGGCRIRRDRDHLLGGRRILDHAFRCRRSRPHLRGHARRPGVVDGRWRPGCARRRSFHVRSVGHVRRERRRCEIWFTRRSHERRSPVTGCSYRLSHASDQEERSEEGRPEEDRTEEGQRHPEALLSLRRPTSGTESDRQRSLDRGRRTAWVWVTLATSRSSWRTSVSTTIVVPPTWSGRAVATTVPPSPPRGSSSSIRSSRSRWHPPAG